MKFGIVPIKRVKEVNRVFGIDFNETHVQEYEQSLKLGHTVRKQILATHQLRMSTDSLKLKDYYDTLKDACTALDIKASSWTQLETKLASYQEDIFLHPSFSNESHHTSLHDSDVVTKNITVGYKYICTTTINSSTNKLEQTKFKQSPVRMYGDSDDTKTIIADTFTSNFLTASVTVDKNGKYLSDDIPDNIVWSCSLESKPKLTAKPRIEVKETKSHDMRQSVKEKIKWNTSTKYASRLRLPYDKAWIGSFEGYAVVLGQDSEYRICIQLRTDREKYVNLFYLLDTDSISELYWYPNTSLIHAELYLNCIQILFQFNSVLDVINHYWGLRTSPFEYVVTTRKQLHQNRARNKIKRPDKRTREAMKASKPIDLKHMSQAQLRARSVNKK